ncbi:MAG: PKD domain-containing protein, partial [Flavobacteriales bacterium]|nr:PKD domain-containing protein [Flavobacteriales bacterium]
SGGTAPYIYSIAGPTSASSGSGFFGGLPAGNYTVTVTGAGGCVTTATVTIAGPTPVVVLTTIVDETCDGDCNGSIDISASGGTPGYTYDWTDIGGPSNVEDRTGLCDGTFTVIVTDNNGCSQTLPLVVNPGILMNAVITPIANQCLTGNSFTFNGGSSTVGVTSYNWNFGDAGTGTGAAPTHVYASSGTYTVTLTVSDGTCSDVVTQNVTVFDMPIVAASGTNISCFGLSDGTVSAVGSITSGYTYAWDIPAAGAAQSGLGAGAYTVTVTDVNGCTATDAYTVTEPPLLVVAATGTNASCNGVCDGTLDGTISGGTLPYTISWSGGPSSGTEDQTSVCAGAYTLTVTDANGCVQTASYTVTEPALLTATSTSTNVSCFGVCDGTLDATIGGGTLAYTYSWGGGPTPTLEDQTSVCAGAYTLTITDANGCVATTNSTITEPPLFTVTVTGTDASCNGVCDGTVSSVVTGGTGLITYAWDNGAGVAATATGLCANTYSLIVTDANGCTAAGSYTVTEPPLLVVAATGTNVSCNGVCDGVLDGTISGGT